MIKIGIDVSCLANPLTGIGRYTLNIVKELEKREEIEIFLYSHSVLHNDILNHFIKLKVTVFDTSGNKVLKFIKAQLLLAYLLKKDKVDIFWGPSHKIPFFISRKIPSVVTIHDLVYKYYPETMHFQTRMLSYIDIPHSIKKTKHIITDSLTVKKEILKNFNVEKDKISVIYLGSNLLNSLPFKKQDIPQNFILFVGTLEPRKNLLRLLQAYKKLDHQIKQEYPLLIVGGKGWGNVSLEENIELLDLKKYCRLLGYVDEQTLESLYQNCSFLAFPSLYEGFGLPIIEAAKYGKRILTSNTSSMPEVAGDYGVYVDPLSVDSIYDGILKLIEDHAHKEPLQKFTWEKSANELVNVFKNVLNLDNKPL